MYYYTEDSHFFGKTSAEELAERYGTPLYVYNESILRERMREMTGLLKDESFTVNYSIKTNANIHILRIALQEGLNADAMSPGEIHVLLEAGFPADRIFFVANNISEEEMRYAIDRGIMISMDSVSQIIRFGKINRGGRCAIRLNPGIGAGHHEKVVTAGEKTKFAVSESDIDDAIRAAEKYDIEIVGVNQHIGSLFMDSAPFLEAVTSFLSLAERFKNLEFVDFGGGFGIPYKKLSGQERFDLDTFSQKLTDIVFNWRKKYGRNVVFKAEPGRYIAAECGVLLGRVHAIKNNDDDKYIGTDIGMNVLVRPSMYDSWHDIEVYRNDLPLDDLEGTEEVTIVGNICETGDILASNRLLPRIKEGDILCVLDAGAYGYSMASNYNNRLRPAEVMIGTDGQDRLIRRREELRDLMNLFPNRM
ncbi:MAG: diaminopimelate decarboxylase [Clostridiales bacterium]|nr:diaminopimelate decarboxylase [Clostridiales bacterium]